PRRANDEILQLSWRQRRGPAGSLGRSLRELYNSKNASAESAIHFRLHFVARLEAFPESISTSDVLDGKLICRTESRFQRSCVSISSILGLCPRLTMKRAFGAKHLH